MQYMAFCRIKERARALMFTLLTKNGDFLCIYDYNHPSWKYGYSHKIYPMKPNCVEMIHMIKSANVTPTYLPHILWDENDRMFFR